MLHRKQIQLLILLVILVVAVYIVSIQVKTTTTTTKQLNKQENEEFIFPNARKDQKKKSKKDFKLKHLILLLFHKS